MAITSIKYLKDEDGNVISPVTSFDSVFTSTGGGIKQVLLDLVYPIGSIYISTKNVNPGTFLGGEWQQITDKFLLAAGGSYTAGSTGGSATKTISKANLPNYTLYNASHTHTFTGTAASHNHSISNIQYTTGYGNNVNAANTGQGHGTSYTNSTSITPSGTNSSTTITVSSGGSGTALDIMPPYEVVYMWKRIKTGSGEPENPS